MLHELPAAASPCQALPVPPQHPPGAGWGERCLGSTCPLGERRLWNDTITPAERAARGHRGCRVCPKLFRRLREPPRAAAPPGLTRAACGDPGALGWGWIQPGPLQAATRRLSLLPAHPGVSPPRQGSRMAPALRTVSSWSGVSSDSQITSWLWVVQGAPHRSTAPHCWGGGHTHPPELGDTSPLLPQGCGFTLATAPKPAAVLPAEPRKQPCCQDLPSPRPPCTRALEEPVWALRAERPPRPRGEGRKGARSPAPRDTCSSLPRGWFGASWVPAPHQMA